MEREEKDRHEKDSLCNFVTICFKSSDRSFMFFSILVVFIIGAWFNSTGYYFTVYNAVFSLMVPLVIFLMRKYINKTMYFWVLNLILLISTEAIFFKLHGTVQSFNIILLLFSMAAFSLISLIEITEYPIVVKDQRVNSAKRIVDICLRSEGFNLLLVLNTWLIFFAISQSWLLTMDCNDEGALFFVIYGMILAFIFSLPIIIFGAVLSLRNVAKGLPAMLRFVILVAVTILLWIFASAAIGYYNVLYLAF